MKKIIRLSLIALCLCLSVSALAGCGSTFSAEKPIIAVSREDGSGTRNAFMELIFTAAYPTGVTPTPDPKSETTPPANLPYWETVKLPANCVVQNSTAAVLSKVKSDGQAIGYDSLGFVTKDVNVLSVDGIACTVANIRNGSYKIARPLAIVYKEARVTGAAHKKFLEFLVSKEAQTIIFDEGYIEDTTRTTPYVQQAGLTGTINISGSTSLEPLMKKLRDAFIAKQSGVTIVVSGGGSGQGRTQVRDDVVEIGMVSAAVSDPQRTDMQSKGGTVKDTLIANDGIAIIVHKTNTSIKDITTAQLQNIFNKDATTKYATWADLIAEQKSA